MPAIRKGDEDSGRSPRGLDSTHRWQVAGRPKCPYCGGTGKRLLPMPHDWTLYGVRRCLPCKGTGETR